MQLDDHHIHIWRTDVQAVPKALLSQYWQLLSVDEKQRNQRYRFERDQNRDCITRALIRTVLSRYGDLPAAAWQFTKGEHGKPEINNSPIPLRFNVSHTTRYIACAITNGRDVGVDIEHTQRKNDVLAIAGHYFSAQEVKDLFVLPVDQQESVFFDYWTLKEAYMKARGEGISLGLGNFSFDLTVRDRITIKCDEKLQDNPCDWFFKLYQPLQDHRMALAFRVTGLQSVPHVEQFDVFPLADTVY